MFPAGNKWTEEIQQWSFEWWEGQKWQNIVKKTIDDSKDDNNGDSKDDSNDDNNGDNNDNLHKQSPPAPILTGKRLRRDPVSLLL